jgi:hypothetical protein
LVERKAGVGKLCSNSRNQQSRAAGVTLFFGIGIAAVTKGTRQRERHPHPAGQNCLPSGPICPRSASPEETMEEFIGAVFYWIAIAGISMLALSLLMLILMPALECFALLLCIPYGIFCFFRELFRPPQS